MEDALARIIIKHAERRGSLNPCCNGRCTRTVCKDAEVKNFESLNPCCNGRCTRTREYQPYHR